jgi:hypothetical protein
MESDILGVFWGVLRLCGVVGEERNAKLVFLAITSRLLKEPVSIVIKGLSSSGKSFTVVKVVEFFPAEAVATFTAMSERALIYSDEEYAHRTIILYEATALREQREKNEGNQTAYFIRTLLSEGRIDYSVTIRDKDEGFKTKHIVKTGPTNVIITTTALSLHNENETRMISLSTDDTAAQTRAIMKQMAVGSAEDVNPEWHDLQRWLATAERRVAIPFAEFLAENIPPVAVRLRRDFRAILRLIDTHALLHQLSRDKDAQGRIIATVADYAAVRGLIIDLISAGIGATVTKTVRETVEAVRQLDKGDGARTEAIGDHLKIERSAAQRRLTSARQDGFIVNLEEKRGKPARYTIGSPMPDEIEVMPTVEAVHAHLEASHTPVHTPNGLDEKENREGCAGVHGVQSPCDEPPFSVLRCDRCGERHSELDPVLKTYAEGSVFWLHRGCSTDADIDHLMRRDCTDA